MIFGKKQGKEEKRFTRIFYATDIHGSELCFRKFINADQNYRADILILGGDVTGKMVIPMVKQNDGTIKCNFLGQDSLLKTDAEYKQLESKIIDTGFYPYPISMKEMEAIGNNKEKVDEIFKKLVAERLERWVKMAEDRFRGKDTKIFMTGGNDDYFLIEDILNRSDVVVNPEGRVVRIDEHHEMIGSGYSNMTPWNCPRDIQDEELDKKINELIPKVENVNNCIFCFHAPPKDSTIDSCPKVDSSVYPPKLKMRLFRKKRGFIVKKPFSRDKATQNARKDDSKNPGILSFGVAISQASLFWLVCG